MRTIIAPVNFSPNSHNAAIYAADMALAAQADLHLYYVLQIPITSGEFPVNDYVFAEMKEAGAESLKNLWEALIKRTDAKVNIFTHMEVGYIDHKIEEFCTEKKPFVVVMGASGGAWDRILTGNSIASAIKHLPFPLIIVPEKAVFREIKKVVLACDLDDMAGGIPVKPSFLRELRTVFNTRFEVVNVNTRRQQRTPASVKEVDTWKECARGNFPEVHFIQTDNVEEGIGQYLEEHPADLLLVFPKKHKVFEFHKSHAKKIAFNSTVPIMSIHA